jgi:hypothetical protein
LKTTENDQQNKHKKRLYVPVPEGGAGAEESIGHHPGHFFLLSEIINHIMEKFVYWINAN